MVYVIGCHLTEFNRRKDGSSYRDWVCETFEASLAMSSLERKDIIQQPCHAKQAGR